MGRRKLQNERCCVICGSDTTYLSKSGYTQWRRVHGHYMCNRCYFREIVNPCSLKFKEKRLMLPIVARKHICSRCGNKIGDEYTNFEGVSARTKRTVIHYHSYNDDDVMMMMSSKMPRNYVRHVMLEWGGRQNVEGNILISSGNRGKKVFIKIEKEIDD